MYKYTIYIFHKNGADSHYTALKHLLEKKNIKLKHREFSVFGTMFKILFGSKKKGFQKQIVNVCFIINLLFSRHKKVVLGIAPFDPKLIILSWLLRNHIVYYHTSWTCWDGSFHPKRKKNTKKVKLCWKFFLENQAEHIFTVTEISKAKILKNYSIKSNKISVVYHSLNPVFFNKKSTNKKKSLSFIYYGRMLPEKGIQELLEYFSKCKRASLTLIGNGKEVANIIKYSSTNNNIKYIDYIDDKQKLIELISKHEYLILNSKKTNKWEELFGLVIIECMSQGTVPVATNHSGPREIITEDVGYLCKEENMTQQLDKIIIAGTFNKQMSANAKMKAKIYLVDNISDYWKPILED